MHVPKSSKYRVTLILHPNYHGDVPEADLIQYVKHWFKQMAGVGHVESVTVEKLESKFPPEPITASTVTGKKRK